MKNNLKIEKNFVKRQISSRLKCTLCLHIFQKPQRLFCGHTFCKPCLEEYLQDENQEDIHILCPTCKDQVSKENVGPDLIASNIIDHLQVQCPTIGCPWIGENRFLKRHYKYQCNFKQLLSFDKQFVLSDLDEEQFDIRTDDESLLEGHQHLEITEKITAEEYRYYTPPVEQKNILLISRSVQTQSQFTPTELSVVSQPIKKRKRRTKQQMLEYRQKLKYDSMVKKIYGNGKRSFVKFQKNAPEISQNEDMKEVQSLYDQMGFDFYADHDLDPKKPIIVNVDKPKEILRERW